jgi:hypothetical protein
LKYSLMVARLIKIIQRENFQRSQDNSSAQTSFDLSEDEAAEVG